MLVIQYIFKISVWFISQISVKLIFGSAVNCYEWFVLVFFFFYLYRNIISAWLDCSPHPMVWWKVVVVLTVSSPVLLLSFLSGLDQAITHFNHKTWSTIQTAALRLNCEMSTDDQCGVLATKDSPRQNYVYSHLHNKPIRIQYEITQNTSRDDIL